MSLSINKLIVNSLNGGRGKFHLQFTWAFRALQKKDTQPSENYPSSFILRRPLFFFGVETIFKEFLTIRSRTLHTVLKQHRKFSFLALMRFFTTHKVSSQKKIFSGLQFVKFSSQNFIQKTFLVSVFFCHRKNPLKNFLFQNYFSPSRKWLKKFFK